MYLEQLSEDLESLANFADTWKGRKMPGEEISRISFSVLSENIRPGAYSLHMA